MSQESLSKKAETDLLLREYEELSKLYAPVDDEVARVCMHFPADYCSCWPCAPRKRC